jgi:hypothetical protein
VQAGVEPLGALGRHVLAQHPDQDALAHGFDERVKGEQQDDGVH